MLSSPAVWAFQTNIRGTAGWGFATAVAVDAAGDIAAGGVLTNIGTQVDFAVAKFSGADGTELWRKVINGTAIIPPGQTGQTDQLNAIAVDRKGDVIAAGETDNAGTAWDITVIKFSGADGTELWRRVINGTLNVNDLARALAVDAAGDVVVGGSILNSPGLSFFIVLKLSGVDGTELWRAEFQAPGGVSSLARAVTLDAAGDVIATGGDFAKLSGTTGSVLWKSSGLGNALAVDASGDVIAGGTAFGFFAVMKLSGDDGSELWRRQIGGEGPFSGANQVRVDPAGNVVAAGGTGNPLNFTVVRLNGLTGDLLWQKDIIGSVPANNQALGVGLDAAGDVLAAGETWNTTNSTNCGGFTVVKLSRLDGAVIWQQVVNGPFDICGTASAIAVGATGDAVVAGSLSNGFSGDFSVVKLKGADGSGGSPSISLVSDLVALNSVMTSFNSTPVPSGPAGTYTITASFTNTSATPIDSAVFAVTALTNENLLLNADDATQTAGARLTPDVGVDGVLSPGESLQVEFVIGLAVRMRFTFFVELLGAVAP